MYKLSPIEPILKLTRSNFNRATGFSDLSSLSLLFLYPNWFRGNMEPLTPRSAEEILFLRLGHSVCAVRGVPGFDNRFRDEVEDDRERENARTVLIRCT